MRPIFSHVIPFFIVMITLPDCSYLRLQQSVRTMPGDWTMYGGDAQRRNYTQDIIKPPLTLAWEYDASAGFGPTSASAADSFLFVGNLQGEVHAISINTGKSVGVHDFGSAIAGTPIIENDMLFVALAHDEDGLIAYQIQYGSIKWKVKVGDVETSPLLIGHRLYVTSLAGKLWCLEKNDGSVVWTFELPQHIRTRIIRSSPASDGKTIVFGTDNGLLYAVGIDDGKLQWTAATHGSILGSPSINKGIVFAGSLDSTLYAFDLATGKQRWAQKLNAGIFSSQAVDDQHVYVGTAGRMIYCVNIETGTIVWHVSTNGVVNAAPLVSGNVVYVGCIDKTLYALSAHDGELLWQYKAEGRIKTMPIISKNYLFLFVEDHSVVALTTPRVQ